METINKAGQLMKEQYFWTLIWNTALIAMIALSDTSWTNWANSERSVFVKAAIQATESFKVHRMKLVATRGMVEQKPVQVFILAGQSNMEGQAVVDLTGKDYNGGKGTLAYLMQDPAKASMFAHLKNSDGKWAVRDDVFVRYQREDRPLLKGSLAFGFSVYGDAHHFGPELQFGHVMGNDFESPVLLIKTAWGGQEPLQGLSSTIFRR